MVRNAGRQHAAALMNNVRLRLARHPLARRPVGQPLHVCHLLESMDTSGVASHVGDLCNGLDSGDFMASCVCLQGRGVAAERVEPRVQVWALHTAEHGEPGLDTARRLAGLLRRYGVDLLQIHGTGPHYPLGVLAARLAGVALTMLTAHQLTDGAAAMPVRGLWWPQVLRWTDGFTATAPPMADQLARRLGIARDQVAVIPKGVDCERYCPPPDREAARLALGISSPEVVLGTVGPLVPRKRQQLLLEAAAQLRDAGARPRLLLVGRGPQRRSLQQRAEQLGLGAALTILERAPDLPALLWAMDIYVVPGPHQGVSSAVLEAMASGLPVVAVNAGAAPQLVHDGETGLLVPEDDAAVLARILGQLADSPQRRQSMGQRARSHVEANHQLETMVQSHAALYHELSFVEGKDELS